MGESEVSFRMGWFVSLIFGHTLRIIVRPTCSANECRVTWSTQPIFINYIEVPGLAISFYYRIELDRHISLCKTRNPI